MVTSSGNSRRGRNLNFELNLIPFIDVLSTCICFLLITVVFLQLGTLNVRQAIGDGAAAQKQGPTLWLRMDDDGLLEVSVKNVKPSSASNFSIKAQSRTPDWDRLQSSLKMVKSSYPTLATGLIMPASRTKYSDVIRAMELVKRGAIAQVGIAPL
jgi:biopolymer transport protein TolR